MRVLGQRAAEPVQRLAIVAAGAVDQAQTRKGAEMARFQRQHLHAVGHRSVEAPRQIIGGGAPVPGLGEAGRRLDQL